MASFAHQASLNIMKILIQLHVPIFDRATPTNNAVTHTTTTTCCKSLNQNEANCFKNEANLCYKTKITNEAADASLVAAPLKLVMPQLRNSDK
jgi:hypothetical protein